MKNGKRVTCSQICVDCVKNDLNGFSHGQHEYLGFDFFVKCEDTENIQQAIEITLKELEMPFVRMYVVGPVYKNAHNVWNRDRVIRAIVSNAEYFKYEDRRINGTSR